jgi:hypothetical protein
MTARYGVGRPGVAGLVWVVRMWWVPMDVWYIPVMIAERLGTQTPAVLNAFGKRQPSAASRSRLGVRATRSP